MEQLKIIKINGQGDLVESWQLFLIGQGLFNEESNGKFDIETKTATIAFQQKHNLQPDGVVGNKTFGIAMTLNFNGIIDDRTDKSGPNFPSKPSFPPLTTNSERQDIFKKFSFAHQPIPGNKENIRITDNWESENIIMLETPQLIGIKGNYRARFHKLASRQFMKLWQDWEDAELLNLIISWDGSFVPRFVRGSTKTLSNHAFGSAFDINV